MINFSNNLQFDFIYPKAALTDSLITSPNYPVISIRPFPGILTDSTNNVLPPTEVQANPLAIPGIRIY